ncbi:MAG: hypothetical protein DME99_09910 [Verrucomicrobia bacterium]|nr:MAG: hypothetical protein DME99_09910 [Verrucomicrobiota bacterium]
MQTQSRFRLVAGAGNDRVSLQIAFLDVSTDRHSVGQQHRVRAKRKRRRTYLRRKKTAARASATRPTPSKQRTKKEPSPAE